MIKTLYLFLLFCNFTPAREPEGRLIIYNTIWGTTDIRLNSIKNYFEYFNKTKNNSEVIVYNNHICIELSKLKDSILNKKELELKEYEKRIRTVVIYQNFNNFDTIGFGMHNIMEINSKYYRTDTSIFYKYVVPLIPLEEANEILNFKTFIK